MMRWITKVMTLVGLFFLVAVAALLLQIDAASVGTADALVPGSGRWVCLFLILAELAGFAWLYLAVVPRGGKMVLKEHATDEDRRVFAAEMAKRLARNKFVLDAGLKPEDPDFLERSLALLDEEADREIRLGGKRVFLGTALAQNGRLDALIVFFSLVRMIWRISAIYNQRPTPREIMSVYAAVSTTTFVAFSIDALDIPQTITDSVGQIVPSVAPAMGAASLPFVGSALHVFTQAAIEGAANCLLAVRSGVVTKKAFRYAVFGGEEAQKRACIAETGSILVDITQETMGAIITAMKKQLLALSSLTGRKVAEAGGTVAGTVAGAAAGAAETVAGGVVSAGVKLGEAVVGGAESLGDAVISGGGAMGGGIQTGARMVKSAGSMAWSVAKKGGSLIGGLLHRNKE
ncbi:MAG: DUF697 domain-containing protein [Desulfovibrio sp.]|nr:DUF697 domain-containing protein [Desulfovibrio sp.]